MMDKARMRRRAAIRQRRWFRDMGSFEHGRLHLLELPGGETFFTSHPERGLVRVIVDDRPPDAAEYRPEPAADAVRLYRTDGAYCVFLPGSGHEPFTVKA